MDIYALRLSPHQDLRLEIEMLCEQQKWTAAWIVTCVGSLQHVSLRMAGAKEKTILEGPFEITSLVGTLSLHGVHLHINISDKTGMVIGGHLCRNSTIYTTAEIVIGYHADIQFARKLDIETGYEELEIQQPIKNSMILEPFKPKKEHQKRE